MLFIPHSTALRIYKRPYVTYSVMLLCMIVFYLQITNSAEITRSVSHYCESVYRPGVQSSRLDVLAQDKYECHNLLGYLHVRKDHGGFERFEQNVMDDFSFKEEEKIQIVQMVKDHLSQFQQNTPASVTGNLMHYPDELNPAPMITSALAHGDWGHIIFNLIFFLAFAPAVEILVNNRLHYLGLLVGISIICSLSYAFSILISGGDPVPSLGLSGVVFGMIGMSAYLMPHARIRVFVWFLTIVRNVYVPAWILAAWYIGWDIYHLMSGENNNGINLVAHVSGGLAGYLIGMIWLKERREEMSDELEDEIEYMRAQRAIGGATYSYSGGRRQMENQQRQKQASKNYEKYLSELYGYVETHRDSEAIVLMLKDYDLQSASIEIFEDLYQRVKDWRDSRFLLCLSRLIINLLVQQQKFIRALLYVEQSQTVTEDFVLADPDSILFLANTARDNHQYQLAYLLVRDAYNRYGIRGDTVQCQLLEVELLWQHLGNREQARETIKRYLCLDDLGSKNQLLDMARLLQETS